MVRKKRVLLIAFITVFLDLIGFGVIIPIQPFYAEFLGASPTLVTMLGAAYSLMQFLFAPMWGRMSDRWGRRPIILFGITTSIVGYTIFGLADTLLVLFASRLLTGFGNANIGAAQAIIADVTDEKDRAKGMGLIGAAFGLGFIFGPAIGGALGQISPTAPAFGAAILAGMNLVSAFFLLPETNTSKGAVSSGGHHRPGLSLAALKDALQRKSVAPLLGVTLITILAFALMEQIVGLYIGNTWVGVQAGTGDHLKEAASITSIFLVVVGVTATIVQGGLIGRLSSRFGERKLIVFGVLIMALGMFLAPVLLSAPQNWFFLSVGAVLFALGMGVFNPSTTSFLSQNVSKQDQGAMLGLNQSMASLGRIIGPLIAGPIFEVGIDQPFFVAGILLILGFFLALKLGKES